MDGVSFPTRIEGLATLTVTADAEVMQNYQSALPVAANQTLAAVEDSAGNPMVFSIGGDKRLYLIMADPGGPTGWKQLDLTASLSRWGTPTTFTVSQVPGGNITLAVAAAPSTGAPVIVAAGPLSNDAAQTDWTKLADYWVVVGNPQPQATLDALYLGPVDASSGYGIPLLAVGFSGGTPGAPNDYLFTPGVTATGVSWSASPFPTPTDSSDIHDYAMGTVAGLGTGVYILYDNTLGQSQLVFMTLPDAYGRHYARELTAPSGATCLASTASSGGGTDLYVGGTSGVFLFSSKNQGDRAVGLGIASSQDVPGLREGGLLVRQDQVSGGTTAIWALSGENLLYFHSSATEPGGYSKPVVFEAGVAEMAAIRSQTKRANQLVFVKTDVLSNPSIVWMWQDPQSSLWQRDLIPLQDTGNTYQFNCYTTTLTFTDPQARARAGLKVKVYASGWTRAIINGVAHLLDQDTGVTATTDLTGNLTLINPITDLATPRFVIMADDPASFDGALVVEPAFKVYNRLRQIQSASDIPPYVLAKLPPGVTQEQVAEGIRKLMSYQPDPAPQGAAIVYQASAPTAKLAVVPPVISAPAQHQPWTLSFGAPQAKTLGLSVVGEVWDGVTNVVGDLWQFATGVIDKVIAVTVDVIQDAVTFVVHLVDKTIQIVIKTLEDVFKAITFILQKVAAAIQDIIRWLGFLFNWQDMWDCHRVMANFVSSGLSYAAGQLDARSDLLKANITGFFTELKTSIHALVLPDEVANSSLQSQQQAVAQTSPDTSMSTTPTNWTLYQVQHGGVANGTVDDTASTPTLGNPVVQFFQDVVVPTVEGLKTDIEKLFQDIGELFQGNPTVGEFLTVVTDFIDTFINAVQNLLIGFIDFANDLLGDIQALLTMALEIPFFSSLYRFVTKLLGSEEELSLVNVLSLMAAIPVTILYKLMTNRELFPSGIEGLLQPDIFAQMMGQPAANKTLVLATTSNQIDWSDPSVIYTHVIGLAPVILVPAAAVLSFFVYKRQLNLDHFGEDMPLDPEARGKLLRSIGYLNLGVLGCKALALACSFPLPRKQSTAADTLAILNWFLGLWRLAGLLLIEPVYKKLSPSPTAPRTARFLSCGHDAVCALVQGGMMLVYDSLDLAAAADQIKEMDEDDEGAAIAGWVFKYGQDLSSVGGSILTDIGNAAAQVPSATVKTAALVSRGVGITLTVFSAACLIVRDVISVGSGVERVLRVDLN